jgi:hypothetical protein
MCARHKKSGLGNLFSGCLRRLRDAKGWALEVIVTP